MSEKRTLHCDRCGRKLPWYSSVIRHVWKIPTGWFINGQYECKDIDLCRGCTNQLKRFMKTPENDETNICDNCQHYNRRFKECNILTHRYGRCLTFEPWESCTKFDPKEEDGKNASGV